MGTSKPRTVRLTDDEVALLQRADEATRRAPLAGERRSGGWTDYMRRVALAQARRDVTAAERKAGR